MSGPLALAVIGFLLPAAAEAVPLVFDGDPRPIESVLDRDLIGPEEQAILRRVFPADAPTAGETDTKVIVVHGMSGRPALVRSVLARSVELGFTTYALLYNSRYRKLSLNAHDLAEAIKNLAFEKPQSVRSFRILATSAGGLLARAALNELARDEGFMSSGLRVSLYAVDTPWHGYLGPGDQSCASGILNALSRWIGDGALEVRSQSDFFLGSPQSGEGDFVGRRGPGLLDPLLPPSFLVRLAFATFGADALDYTEGRLSELPRRWVDALKMNLPMERLTLQQAHFWKALQSTAQFSKTEKKAEVLAQAGELDTQSATQLFSEAFPRFEGDHLSVMDSPDLLLSMEDWLREP